MYNLRDSSKRAVPKRTPSSSAVAPTSKRKKSRSPVHPVVRVIPPEGEKNEKGSNGIFGGKSFYFVPLELPRARRELLEKRVRENSGMVSAKFDFDILEKGKNIPEFIMVDGRVTTEQLFSTLSGKKKKEEMDLKKLGDILDQTQFIRVEWLTDCLHKKALIDADKFRLNTFLKNYISSLCQKPDEVSSSQYLQIPSMSSSQNASPARDYSYHSDDDHKSTASYGSSEDSDQDEDGSFSESPAKLPTSPSKPEVDESDDAAAKLKRSNVFLSPSASGKNGNPNEYLIEQLEELQKTYRNIGDQFRGYAYGRAISSIKKYPHKITSPSQIKELKNVGPRIASHIIEILETGHCEKIDELTQNDDSNKAMTTFVNIHGVGVKTAQKWVQMGYRTLEDIREKVDNLSVDQKVGLKYYDEFLEKMPRAEVEEIADIVKKTVNEIIPGFIFRICGSYIRGRSFCGDVDILMTHPDGQSHNRIIRPLVDHLHKTGFLTDDLWLSEGRHKKYFGVCILPKPGAKHRRLDIIIPPYSDWATCVLGWSGSMYFVRSIRDLAHKKGMSLTDYELRKNVQRVDGESVGGEHVETPTEESIFEALDLPFLRPEQRDH